MARLARVRLGLLAVLAFLLFGAAAVSQVAGSPLPTRRADYAPTVAVTGEVQRPRTLTGDDLRRFPAMQFTNTFGAGQGVATNLYRGALLWDVVQDAGLKNTTGGRNDQLRKFVVATGADGFEVVIALAEIDPSFGGQHVIVAYEKDGAPLGEKSGLAQLVVPGDKRGGHAVFTLVRLDVRDIDSAPRQGK